METELSMTKCPAILTPFLFDQFPNGHAAQGLVFSKSPQFLDEGLCFHVPLGFIRVGGLDDGNRDAVFGDGHTFTLLYAPDQLGKMGLGLIG